MYKKLIFYTFKGNLYLLVCITTQEVSPRYFQIHYELLFWTCSQILDVCFSMYVTAQLILFLYLSILDLVGF